MVQHVDPEVLALLALGEQDVVSDDERAHLASCVACQAERDSLADVASTARELGPEELVAPAPHVWDRIRAEIDQEETSSDAAWVAGVESAEAEVVDLASRRRPAALWAVAAASAALVVGVGGGIAWERAQGPEAVTAPTPVAVAQAELEPLPDWPDSTGSATVEEAAGGELEIVVSVAGADGSGEGAYREVWLIADDLSGMVSLGVLKGDTGTFPVPAGLDLDRYSLVDVSEEPFDGDPTHSGDSIVRGGLDQA
ncbi:anti-sigma factor [Isoptericola sediminis]|uniref:Anti-sigma factor n=1 Tax=Isoptericola sediminis TaxID=2733572 RepID=A0A849KIZ5_9MICO|nr:anti-sigma factor [Isoptericola sediminis]NNU28673.1 anti-sigma factor [Isoptericola sediminis]